MRETVRNNDLLGLFVEGTRQTTGVPGEAKPGAAMVAIHGSQDWAWGKWPPISVAFGEPMRFAEHPRNSKGYRQATDEIETEIRRLWEFLVHMHELGRPRAVPPRREHVPAKVR